MLHVSMKRESFLSIHFQSCHQVKGRFWGFFNKSSVLAFCSENDETFHVVSESTINTF